MKVNTPIIAFMQNYYCKVQTEAVMLLAFYCTEKPSLPSDNKLFSAKNKRKNLKS